MNKEISSNTEIFSTEVSKAVRIWEQISAESETPIYLKGGAIRDSLINFIHGKNLKVKDLDLVVSNGFFKVVQVAQTHGLFIVERGKRKKLPMYQISGTFGLDADLGHLLAHPLDKSDISEQDLLRQDALLSDLNINTISYNLLTGQINDPLGAVKSIKLQQVELVSERSLFLDPATILRCLKVAYKTGFTITPESLEIIRKNAKLILKLQDWFLIKNLDEVLKYATPGQVSASLESLGLIDIKPNLLKYLDEIKK